MPISGKEIVRRLRKLGWEVDGQRGSHVKLRKGKRGTIVPVHGNKSLQRGLLRAIEKQTGEKIL
jgi:predicted RNA binding protein YcfA (HicA-like mRNA interferase family)